MKFLILLVLAIVENVFSFECWVNDPNGPKVPGFFKYKLEDCEDNLSKQIANNPAIRITDFDYACHKLVVETGKEPFVMKGCLPKNGCPDLKKDFETRAATAGQNTVPVKSVRCYECDESGCNSGEKPKVYAGVAFLLALIASLV
ncbi:uncharacterized protein LOC123003815 [Tribolium madens]|uniref:uncharacterized protein LOC123003815 n=1 Tax=Tribolium madens TaxID=41895 RepID=UPI001CF7606A|nr:uncharacterized protein LOC123003815 [Tribolium madens]